MFLNNSNIRSNNGVGCLVIGVLGAVAFFLILRGLYSLLYWITPVLLILTLVIRWKVFPAVFRNWLQTLNTNPLSAILQLVLAVVGFPFFALYLFLLAVGGRKVEQLQNRFRPQDPRAVPEEEFVDFEEIESRPKGSPRNDEPLNPPIIIHEEPPPSRQDEGKKPDNPYEQLFK
ncbi:MAG: hypothetical protein ABIQ93_01115 [Saprospiraceae bacterium]